MITTEDGALAARLRSLQQHGVAAAGGGAFEVHEVPGFNHRLSDLHAALGRPQLARLPAILARRRAIAQRLGDALADNPVLAAAVEPPGVSWNWQSYPARLRERAGIGQAEAMRRLEASGVACRRGLPNAHPEPAYGDRRLRGEGARGLRVSPRLRGNTLPLPIFNAMTDGEVER